MPEACLKRDFGINNVTKAMIEQFVRFKSNSKSISEANLLDWKRGTRTNFPRDTL